jgi:hypothetical protein
MRVLYRSDPEKAWTNADSSLLVVATPRGLKGSIWDLFSPSRRPAATTGIQLPRTANRKGPERLQLRSGERSLGDRRSGFGRRRSRIQRHCLHAVNSIKGTHSGSVSLLLPDTRSELRYCSFAEQRQRSNEASDGHSKMKEKIVYVNYSAKTAKNTAPQASGSPSASEKSGDEEGAGRFPPPLSP